MSLNSLRLRSPADVVSVIPYLVGFHPSDSVVVLACDAAQGTYAVRLDLGAHEALLEHIAELIARRRPETVILAGYGAAGRVTPTIERVRDHLYARDVSLREALRVEDDRFWSYLCEDLRCCPPEGTFVDVKANPVAAAAIAAGLVALPDREELARTLEPIRAEPMRNAMARAEHDFANWAENVAEASPGTDSRAGPGSDSGVVGKADARRTGEPGAATAREPGTAPDTGPSVRPGAALGTGPRAGSGVGPGVGRGVGPGAGSCEVSGIGPGVESGVEPGVGPGTQLGVESGTGPALGPGAGPGEVSGVRPALKPGAGPGVESGIAPGEEFGAGTDVGSGVGPGVEPGTRPGEEPGAGGVPARMVMEGVPLVRRVIEQARAGKDLPSDDEIAWLGLLLTSLRVRDEAWVRMGEQDAEAYVRLWRNVLTRLPEEYAAAPACLLSFAAWRTGNGALANVALDRALAADPHYVMARLLQELFISGLPPWSLPMDLTPDQLDETG